MPSTKKRPGRTLLVLRHAKSSWKDRGLSDHDRPLNKRGRRDAPRMGQLLREQQLVPDVLVSSTATRARTTADAVAKAAGFRGAVDYIEQLYLADPAAILAVLRRVGGTSGRTLIVGHNPGLEALIARLAGRAEHFPTAALAQIELPITRWSELRSSTRGRLVNLWRPKELPADP